jgi:hypothetical protein
MLIVEHRRHNAVLRRHTCSGSKCNTLDGIRMSFQSSYTFSRHIPQSDHAIVRTGQKQSTTQQEVFCENMNVIVVWEGEDLTYCEDCCPLTELIQSSCWKAETGVGGSIDSTYSILITFSYTMNTSDK